jgi:hypothetical protein
MLKFAAKRKIKIKLTGAGPVSNVPIHPEKHPSSVLLVDKPRRGSPVQCHLGGLYDQDRAL